MVRDPGPVDFREPVVAFHLLGRLSLEDGLALQRRLVDEAVTGHPRRIVVLMGEHPESISVGRRGSRAHLRLTGEQLRRAGLAVRWVRRSGGCVLHAPGQLAVYPIVPLAGLGWSGAQYRQRLHHALVRSLQELRIRVHTQPGQLAVWGRSGLLAVVAVAVREGVAYHGAFVNVNPPMRYFPFVDTVPPAETGPGVRPTMGCLLAERHVAVRMASVRSALIEQLAAAFGCPRYHLHTGHPLLVRTSEPPREPSVCDV